MWAWGGWFQAVWSDRFLLRSGVPHHHASPVGVGTAGPDRSSAVLDAPDSRIFPPLYLVLGVVTTLTMSGLLRMEHNTPFRWEAVLAQAFYMANYYDIANPNSFPPGTAVLWSLAVEEHFYLLFPVPFYFYSSESQIEQGSGHLWACVVRYCCGVSSLSLRLGRWRSLPGWRRIRSAYLSLHGHATRFHFAWVHFGDSWKSGAGRNPVSKRHWLFLWLPLALGALLFTFVCRESWFRETWRYTIQGLGDVSNLHCHDSLSGLAFLPYPELGTGPVDRADAHTRPRPTRPFMRAFRSGCLACIHLFRAA